MEQDNMYTVLTIHKLVYNRKPDTMHNDLDKKKQQQQQKTKKQQACTHDNGYNTHCFWPITSCIRTPYTIHSVLANTRLGYTKTDTMYSFLYTVLTNHKIAYNRKPDTMHTDMANTRLGYTKPDTMYTVLTNHKIAYNGKPDNMPTVSDQKLPGLHTWHWKQCTLNLANNKHVYKKPDSIRTVVGQ